MDPGSVQTASQYVNNLLLARGLLRDGVSIDFAAPAKSGHDTTMANVINLIHDLVPQERCRYGKLLAWLLLTVSQRESEHLSSISQSFQELRTRVTQSNQTISRLEAEKAETQRDLSTAKSQARQAKADMKTIETKNKAYKEDIQRLRVSVGQIRAQCANDVRKRDAEITRLKKHIDVRRTRENSSNTGPAGVTIIDPTTGKAHYPASLLKAGPKSSTGSISSLRDETNEHLTSLSAELSESNEALINLVQSTVATLKSLQGQPLDSAGDEPVLETQTGAQATLSEFEPVIHVADTPSLPDLCSQMNETLASLRSLLTNPSFAPIEEVEVRDEELARLRAGWEMMEARWKEAVGLMNGWRHRMIGGDAGTISIDEIQRGLDMAEEGLSVAGSPAQRKRGRKRDSSGSEISQALGDAEISMISNGSDVYGLSPAKDTEDTPKVKRVRIQAPEAGAGLFPAPHVLKPTCGNRRRSPSPKRVSYEYKGAGDPEATPTPAQRVSEPVPSVIRDEMVSPDIWVEPEMSIEQKLQQVQAEAEEARRSKEDLVQQDPTLEASKPVKRNPTTRKTGTKRRSTLTSDELKGLMGVRK